MFKSNESLFDCKIFYSTSFNPRTIRKFVNTSVNNHVRYRFFRMFTILIKPFSNCIAKSISGYIFNLNSNRFSIIERCYSHNDNRIDELVANTLSRPGLGNSSHGTELNRRNVFAYWVVAIISSIILVISTSWDQN